MDEDLLDRLGKYFVTLDIGNKYGITFERFCQLVDRDIWKDYVAA